MGCRLKIYGQHSGLPKQRVRRDAVRNYALKRTMLVHQAQIQGYTRAKGFFLRGLQIPRCLILRTAWLQIGSQMEHN